MTETPRSRADKDRAPSMSSMHKRLVLPSLLLIAITATASAADLTPQQNSWYRARMAGVQPTVTPPPRPDPVAEAVLEWKRLRQSDGYPFSSYAGFLMAHPGWPGEAAMRRAAERSIDPNNYSPAGVVAFFDRFPPQTAVGHARYAEALSARGRPQEAVNAARKAWTAGVLPPEEETRLLTRFGGSFTPADQDARMDALLWAGATTDAARQLPLTSPARRALFDARLAMQTRAPDAALKADAVLSAGLSDAGYIADRANWLRLTGNSIAARQLLAGPRKLVHRPGDVEEWYEVLLANARAAATDTQWTLAYDIARQIDDAYPAGVDVRDQSLGERDDYTSLAWLAGTTALWNRGRAADAVPMFERYALGARSPQTQSKGYYWAGRAAQAANQPEEAARLLNLAANHPDQFYGQLALERLGRPIPAPGTPGGTQISAVEREAFRNREIVKAARVLGELGEWRDQTQFVRAISQSVETDADHLLAAELAGVIGRPDLAVMVGRQARPDGSVNYVRTGFPHVRLPEGQQSWSTIIHAIARQESQFDREAVSHAGARGLMQLMPGTAREQAGKIGLSYDATALTRDPQYNIQLGSAYFQRMLSYYNGSYPLAVAAYNAGPGNVNRWIRENGDPRLPGVDMLRWIEQIPIYETKNYVQRVLENAVVYDLMNPSSARSRSTAPLSAYLGKRTPG